MQPNRYRTFSLTIVFFGILLFPIFNTLLPLIKDSDNLENRRMAQRPVFDINLLDPYPASYEKYYNDNFTIRSLMVKYFNLYNIVSFKRSPFPDLVIIGNNGWLFMDRYSYQGTNRFTNQELETLRKELEYRRNYLSKIGCKFYFAIAPAKTIIYADQVPYTYYRYNKQPRSEQLQEYLSKNSTIKTLDLTTQLKKFKQDNPQLYYKLDTHWNDVGAFYAARSFCEMAHADMPEVNVPSINNYKITTSAKKEGNCIQIIGFSNMFSDTEYKLTPKKNTLVQKVANSEYSFINSYQPIGLATYINNKKNKPKIILSGDSFSEWFVPFLSEGFGSTIYVFDHWRYTFNQELIDVEKPDAYLLLIHEPLLRELLKYQARLGNHGKAAEANKK